MTPPLDETAGILVGLGSPYRGDDAVGPLIVRRVGERLDARIGHVRVVTFADPSALLELLDGYDFALIVDAIRTGGEPGNLLVLEAGAETEAMPETLSAGTGRGGTHALGLAGCIELARVLHRLPRRLLVVGVEAVQFEPGAELSAPVRAAVGNAVETVARLLLAHADRQGGSS